MPQEHCLNEMILCKCNQMRPVGIMSVVKPSKVKMFIKQEVPNCYVSVLDEA